MNAQMTLEFPMKRIHMCFIHATFLFLKDPDEIEEDEKDQVEIDEKFLPEKKQRDISAEDKRKDHQKELAQQMNEEAKVWNYISFSSFPFIYIYIYTYILYILYNIYI